MTLSGHPVDSRRRYASLEELQAETDDRVERWAKRALYPVTERWGHQRWERALERLAPLPILPAPFDVAVTRTVQCDALVQLGLEHVTAQLDDSVSDAVKANAAPHVFFEKLLSGGLQQRERGASRRRTSVDKHHGRLLPRMCCHRGGTIDPGRAGGPGARAPELRTGSP